MPAKSLGTLAIIYVVHKLQYPLPPCTMLCHGDMNNPTCTSDTFLHSYGFQVANQHCMRGKGGNTLLVDMEIEGDTRIHRNLRVFQGLLAGIVVLRGCVAIFLYCDYNCIHLLKNVAF